MVYLLNSGNSSIKKIFPQLFLRFICLKHLNKNKEDCADFETRFCCPKTASIQTEFISTNKKNEIWPEKTWPESLNDLRKLK